MLTSKGYTEKKGLVCPVCGSKDVVATRFFDSENLTQDVDCEACCATWVETYELTGYVCLELNG